MVKMHISKPHPGFLNQHPSLNSAKSWTLDKDLSRIASSVLVGGLGEVRQEGKSVKGILMKELSQWASGTQL